MQRNSLRYFVTIAEHGSMRAAADVLHISQSALSRQVINMEEELGAPLLERLPRGIGLTSAGEIFLRYAREGLAQYDHVKFELSALQGLHRGTVRIAAPEVFTNLILPGCLQAFHAQYPGVNIVTGIHTTRGIVSDVRDGVVDFGIAYNPELDEDMQVNFSVPESIVAVMNPANPLAERKNLSLSDLVGVPLALPTTQSATGELIFQMARRQGIKLRSMLESNSVQVRLKMAMSTDIVSLLVHLSAVDEVKAGRAHVVPMREKVFNQGNISLFSVPRRRLSGAADSFQRMVTRELQSLRRN